MEVRELLTKYGFDGDDDSSGSRSVLSKLLKATPPHKTKSMELMNTS
jgi:translation elongation factor EF-Tu-like GTPase